MGRGLEGLPSAVGRYELRGLLGRGGMGRVVLGFDPVLRREVAIKLVEPMSVSLEDLPEMRFMFHREARATAALRHPNVVEVFDYSGPEAELMYLACEKIDGPTLRGVLDAQKKLAPAVVAALGYELCAALEAAHGKDIVHRDLKCENVFWEDSGRVVLGDFGIAKAFGGSARLGGTIEFGRTNLYGSPSTMAPEQLAGEDVGPAADLFALGAVLYECLSGKPAFDGANIDEILERVQAARHPPLAVRNAPPALVSVVEHLLHKDVRSRPPSARDVGRRLRGVLDELSVSDPRLALRAQGEQTRLTPSEAARLSAQDAPTRLTTVAPSATADSSSLRGARSAQASHRFNPLPWLVLAVALGVVAAVVVVVGRADSAAVSPTAVVPVHLRFDGAVALFIDGAAVGNFVGEATLSLPPGVHELAAHGAAGVVERRVTVLPGTSPTFELR